jgi:hypothetical protein
LSARTRNIFLASLNVRRHSRGCAKLLAFAAMRRSSIRSHGTSYKRGRSMMVAQSEAAHLADKRPYDGDDDAEENLARHRIPAHCGFDRPHEHRGWPQLPKSASRGCSGSRTVSRYSWGGEFVPGTGGWRQVLRSPLVLSGLIAPSRLIAWRSYNLRFLKNGGDPERRARCANCKSGKPLDEPSRELFPATEASSMVRNLAKE